MTYYRVMSHIHPISDWLVSLEEARRIQKNCHPALCAYIATEVRS